jgi:hypothetical protein
VQSIVALSQLSSRVDKTSVASFNIDISDCCGDSFAHAICGLDATKIAADDEIALESALLRECTWLEFTQYDEHGAMQHANISGGKFDVFMLGWKLVEERGGLEVGRNLPI